MKIHINLNLETVKLTNRRPTKLSGFFCMQDGQPYSILDRLGLILSVLVASALPTRLSPTPDEQRPRQIDSVLLEKAQRFVAK